MGQEHALVATLGDPQAAGVEQSHDLAATHGLRTRGDQRGIPLLGNVVVVALERPPGKPGRVSEAVQLLEGGVADQV